MASRLLNPGLFHLRTTPLLAAGFGAGSAAGLLLMHTYQSRSALRFDSSPVAASPRDWSVAQYQTNARVPIVKDGRFNTGAVRQLSAGSVFGLLAGLTVSFFSKPLALLLGLLIVGVQAAESYGIRVVPYSLLQRYAKNIDLRSAVQDNIAFKLSFGSIFALSAFASF